MTKKKPFLTIFLLVMATVLLFSCAAQRDVRQETDPILGQWKTNQNILLTVHRLAGNELVAEMKSAPGFFTSDLGAGSIIVRNIQPLSPGKYSGIFAMPGAEQPLKVQLRFRNRNTITVNTPDRRAQGNQMVWRRMATPATKKP